MIESQGRTVVREHHGVKSLTERDPAEHLVVSAIWSREDPRFPDIVYKASPSFFIHFKCGVPTLKGM